MRIPAISIIVPALNEAAGLARNLAPLQAWRAHGDEVLLVDGGSTDGTPAIAAPSVDAVLASPPGRARQMNAGARASRGHLLLFLHADTTLPSEARALLARFARPDWRGWGRFDVRLSGRHPLLRVVERAMNVRSRVTGIATGDQAIFVSRALFDTVGGYPDQPLMEDVELSARLRARAWPECVRAPVMTSSRRWEVDGIVRTIVRMWWFRWQYFRGADVAALAARYRHTRERPVHAAGPPGEVQATRHGRAAVVVFARRPIPGATKTRLVPALGAAGAARLYARLLARTLNEVTRVPGVQRCLYVDDADAVPWFRARLPEDWRVRTQRGDTLGARMSQALTEVLAEHPRAVLLGSDIIDFETAHVVAALQALAGGDEAVVAPAADGGYWLIGLRRPCPTLFDGIGWGTPEVYAETVRRLAEAGMGWRALARCHDVDTPDDLAALAALLDRSARAPLLAGEFGAELFYPAQ
ncbi:MAG: TIGR04283 family arsenosugar biosynthesis glycosyltransferase [Gammaproteobacteria bacterium]